MLKPFQGYLVVKIVLKVMSGAGLIAVLHVQIITRTSLVQTIPKFVATSVSGQKSVAQSLAFIMTKIIIQNMRAQENCC